MSTVPRFCCCVLTLLLTPPCLGLDTSHKSLAGRWKGAILVRPAELEVGLDIDITENAETLSGSIAFPTQDGSTHALSQVDSRDSSIQIIYKDSNSDASVFTGTLSADAKELTGTVLDGGKTFPFILRKVLVQPQAPAVMTLSSDGAELRSQFEKDRGGVRLILILSPTCTACKNSARLVQTYVLDQIKDPNLRIYAVWEHVAAADSETEAREASRLLAGARVSHYWANHRFTGSSFPGLLGPQNSPPWDVVLVFGPRAEWTSGPQGPVPEYFMHNLRDSESFSDRKLNGVKLAEKINEILQGPVKPVAEKPFDKLKALVDQREVSLDRPEEGDDPL